MPRDAISFRTRKVEIKRPFPVIFADEVPELEGDGSSTRPLHQVATGVEKEEEDEHHLQDAIKSHVAAYTSGAKQTYIPIPEASRKVDTQEYEKLHSPTFSLPNNLVRFSTPLEEILNVPYDLDEIDDQFLKTVEGLSPDDFERIMAIAEKAMSYKKAVKRTKESKWWKAIDLNPTPQKPEMIDEERLRHDLNSEGLSRLLPHVETVYKHWRSRREVNGDKPIHSDIRIDEDDTGHDPYVSFRKRELKAPRKTRRSDTDSLARSKEIFNDLEAGLSLLRSVLAREEDKSQLFDTEARVFEARADIARKRKDLGVEDPKSASKKKVALARRKRLQRKLPGLGMLQTSSPPSELEDDWIDMNKNPIHAMDISHPQRQYYRRQLQIYGSQNVMPCARMRVGRGGRLWYDRGTISTLRDKISDPTVLHSVQQALKYEDLSDDEDEQPTIQPSLSFENFDPRRQRLMAQVIAMRCKLLAAEMSKSDPENVKLSTPHSAFAGPLPTFMPAPSVTAPPVHTNSIAPSMPPIAAAPTIPPSIPQGVT